MGHFLDWIPLFEDAPRVLLIAAITYVWLATIRHLRPLLNRWLDYLITPILRSLGTPLSTWLATVSTIKLYCERSLAGSTKYVVVPGLRDLRLDIDNIFVPLTIQTAHQMPSTPLAPPDQLSYLDILNLRDEAVILIGDAGAGKTTIVQRLFRDQCLQALRRPSRARVPFLLRLRDLAQNDGLDFSTKLEADFFSVVADAPITTFKDLLSPRNSRNPQRRQRKESQGLLILLDGLDEVPAGSLRAVLHATQTLVERLQKAKVGHLVLITMRSQFYSEVRRDLANLFGSVLRIVDFGPTEIYEFLRKWKTFSGSPRPDKDLYGALMDRPALLEICRNPLLLSMYALHEELRESEVTPETRTEFFAQVSEELLLRRRAFLLEDGQSRGLVRRRREDLLAKIAYESLIRPELPANTVDRSTALQCVSETLAIKLEESDLALRSLVIETGLLAYDQGGEYLHYIHRTFWEYFAALEAATRRESGWREVLELSTVTTGSPPASLLNRAWEVIPFMCALVPHYFRKEVLRRVEAQRDPALVAKCILEARDYEEEIVGRCLAGLQGRLRESESDIGRIANDIHLMLILLRELDAHVPVSQRRSLNLDSAAVFQEVVRARGGSAYEVLDALATADVGLALRVADLVDMSPVQNLREMLISNLDQVSVVPVALHLAENDEKEWREWAEIFAEASLRSRIVAWELAAQPPLGAWRIRLHATRYWDRWDCHRGVIFTHTRQDADRNVLTDSLTLALKDGNFRGGLTLVSEVAVLGSPMRSLGEVVGLAFLEFLLVAGCSVAALVSRQAAPIFVLFGCFLVLAMFLANFTYRAKSSIFDVIMQSEGPATVPAFLWAAGEEETRVLRAVELRRGSETPRAGLRGARGRRIRS